MYLANAGDMTFSLIAAFAVPFTLQAATPVQIKPATFADLSIEEATEPRCGVAFAIVQGWQEAGDARGGAWPSMAEAGAREFFLTAMVRLIDRYSLGRSDVTQLVEVETQRHESDKFASVEAMMPGCLVLLESASINGG